MIHVVLLSGGSGTRLWPLSNATRSKQFLKVLRDSAGRHVSMVQRVFEQIRSIEAEIDITIATCEAQRDAIVAQLDGDFNLVLEPERRDTAPAIMLACMNLYLEQKASLQDTVVVMPIDSYVDQEYYNSMSLLDEALQNSSCELSLLGVQPTYPSSKYGYIVPKNIGRAFSEVAQFVEKPSEQDALRLMDKGAFWNCGVFAFKLGYLVGIARRYLDAETYAEFYKRYSELPKNSFDYEVVEKATSVGVVSYAGTWKDLGTWNTLTEEMAEPVSGRAIVDWSSCNNVHVINETQLPVVVAGVEDVVVVATEDGILVSSKEASAHLKDFVEKIKIET